MIRYLTAFILALATLIGESYWAYTCGPGYDYERYRISYVDPDLLSDSIYQSFYRTLLQGHQAGDYYWDRPHEEFRGADWLETQDRENVADWMRYFDGKVTQESVYDIVYRVGTNLLDSMRQTIERGERITSTDTIRDGQYDWEGPDTLHLTSVVTAINARRDADLLTYLLYANACSPHALSGGAWESVKPGVPTIKKLIEEGIQLHNTTPSNFLKLRYGFQVVRLARYAGEYDRVESLYNQYIVPNRTQSPIRYWGLGHVAGAVRLEGDTPRSNYLFSNVFDSCEGNREIALRDFRVKSQEDWRSVYSMAKSDHERSRLWLMLGLRSQRLDFNYMREMYKLEPSSPQLAMALLRELHRIESYLYDNIETRDLKVKQRGFFIYNDKYNPETETWSEYQTNVEVDWGVVEVNWGVDYSRHISSANNWDTLYFYERENEPQLVEKLTGREYVQQFRRFVLEVAKEANVLEPGLWYMVAGYIDMLDGDYDLADECLEEAKEKVVGNYDLKHQIQLLEYLRQAKSKGGISGNLESHIAESLQWLRQKQGKNHHTKYDKVMAALGRQYLIQGDVPKAIVAFATAHDEVARNMLLDVYATTDDLKSLEEIVASGKMPPDLPFDSLGLSAQEIRDIRGTRLMREGKYREAEQLFTSLPNSYWNDSTRQETVCFLFTTNYQVVDTNLPNFVVQGTDETSARMNKREFATTLVALLDQAESGKGSDSAYLQVANLLYNTPYWGYSGVAWDGGLLVLYRYFHFGPTAYPFNIPRVGERMEEAEKYFMELYGSRRQARSYYEKVMEQTKDRELAAHCAYMLDLCDKQPQTSLHPRTEPHTQKREGYELLISKYRDTKYAREVLSQCSVYRYFHM
ncbi:MAG: hypothetical protein KDD67_11450 [Ignavibacteriae bacterium]|nr:hypothetical protein [Ignavibacteriota bacterium]MCB9216592.1 hypothetical protein [Ignavibacteria bacterium]